MKSTQVYTVITDQPALEDFIAWLPELAEHEKYYLCLFARKKYCPEVPWIKSDKSQLKRFVSDKKRMLEKIMQLEVQYGAYQFDGKPMPQESLALYITPNPRDLWKGTIRSIKQLAEVIECSGKNSNPHQEVMSEIHRTCGNKAFIDFDIDTKDPTVICSAIDLVDGRCSVLETRGGYHVMVDAKAAKAGFRDNKWYPKLVEMADVSADKNSMIPVPGTYQGGFTPVLVSKYDDTWNSPELSSSTTQLALGSGLALHA